MPPDPLVADLAAAGESLDLLVRRLRSLSPRARTDRAGAARTALDGLVALEVRLEGCPAKPPAVADHILADAIAVVGGDLLEAVASSADASSLAEMRKLINTALAATR